ncbi:DUF418 domain-containing protein [Aeromicrobium phragmitis]|uniref:DUF418 domain-containing protein n=1 Tax=Aeromicrobium phragmitis TaxID=2478914 RepID=A0A3L8PN64_9ACTN|nr:DUF418 domain-containing protein [Aeromicrobium phragmitis]RLV56847.1 DUF418 domain-containing protein [Aeromicrobium phragmitis]
MPVPDAPRVASATARWALPDLARGFAIVAMLIAHAQVLIPERPEFVSEIFARLNDVASPLFGLVMGMSAAIMLRSNSEPAWRVVWHNVLRGGVLIGLGVWLETWGSWVAIVLAILGCLLVVGTPVLLLGGRAVAAIAVVVFVAAPVVNDAVQRAIDWPGGYHADIANSPNPGELLVRWFIADPHYRVTSLLPFFLAGALLAWSGTARRPDPSWSLAAVCVGGGLELVATWWRAALGDVVESGSLPDAVHDAALVTLALGVCGLLVAWRPAEPVLRPLRELGTVALSLYVLQIAIIAWLNRDELRPVLENDWSGWWLIVLGVAVAGWAWAHWVGRGPVEWLTGIVSGRYRRSRETR